MDIARLITRLWNLRFVVIAAGILSIVISVLMAYDVSLVPPSIKQAKLQTAAAQTQIFLDSPRSTIGDIDSPVEPLASRAAIYTQFLQSDEVRTRIAAVTGLSPKSFTIEGTITGTGAPDQGQRATELLTEGAGTRVFFNAANGSPIISVSTQAPDASVAIGLANGAAKAISDYVGELQQRQHIPRINRLQISQLGAARGGVINNGVGKTQVALTSMGIFIVFCVVILIASNVLLDVRKARRRGDRIDAEWAASVRPSES